jgi:hypothetical protein
MTKRRGCRKLGHYPRARAIFQRVTAVITNLAYMVRRTRLRRTRHEVLTVFGAVFSAVMGAALVRRQFLVAALEVPSIVLLLLACPRPAYRVAVFAAATCFGIACAAVAIVS